MKNRHSHIPNPVSLLTAALTAVLSMHGGQAFAQNASAHVSGLTFTLRDLAPDDGIAPSLTFTHMFHKDQDPQGTSWSMQYTGDDFRWDGDAGPGSVNAPHFLTPGGATMAIKGQTVTASSTSNSLTATIDNAVTQEMILAPKPGQFIEIISYAQPARGHQQFALSANTELTITGQYVLSASTELLRKHRTGANFVLSLGAWNPVLGAYQGSEFYEWASSHVEIAPGHMTNAGDIDVTFTNSTASTLVGDIRGYAYAYSGYYAAAIPEPAVISLAIAGLLVAGVAGHRRSART